MIIKVIACRVLFREISLLAAQSKHLIDVTYLRQGYHNTPDLLRLKLQEEIDLVESGEDSHSLDPKAGKYDAIVLGYGLCSNGVVGVKSKKYPIVIPKAHDCITLFLGSKEKYRNYFDNHRGIYWYNKGWIENTPMPGKDRFDDTYNMYVEKYGQENADMLMEMEQGWMKEYSFATFVDWPQFDNTDDKNYTKECAEFLGWNYDCIMGDSVLLHDLLSGKWDNRFLVLQPGETISPSYDDDIIKAQSK